jgi:hypothetical protein
MATVPPTIAEEPTTISDALRKEIADTLAEKDRPEDLTGKQLFEWVENFRPTTPRESMLYTHFASVQGELTRTLQRVEIEIQKGHVYLAQIATIQTKLAYYRTLLERAIGHSPLEAADEETEVI